jgi:cysteine-rich repeat protein
MRRLSYLLPLAVAGACADDAAEASSGSSGSSTADASTNGPTTVVDSTATTTSDATTSSSASTDDSSSTATEGSTSSDVSSTSTTATSENTTDSSSSSSEDTTQGPTTGSESTGMTESTSSASESTTSAVTTETTESETGGSVCGNGIIEDGEVCDDADLVGGDGCEDDCTSSDDVQPIWTLEQGGAFGFADCGGGVAFDSEDNLILAGIWEDQIWVGKYDLDYVQLWEVTYPAVSGAGGCMTVRVAVDADDNVAVIGPQDANGFYDIFVAKVDAEGAELWNDVFAGAYNNTDNAGDISFDIDGNILLAGELRTTLEYYSFWVAKLTSDGVVVWSDEHAGAAGGSNAALGVATDEVGNVWGVGFETPQLFETDSLMRQYDSDGVLLSNEVIVGVDANSQDIAYDVTLDAQGDRIVGGTFRPDEGIDDNDAWVRRYVGDVEQWATTFEGTGPAEDFAVGVALAPDGTILTSGVMYDAENEGLRNRWLAKLSADGVRVWERRIDESSSEAWVSVAVSTDGRVAVAGSAGFAFPWSTEARYAVYPP